LMALIEKYCGGQASLDVLSSMNPHLNF